MANESESVVVQRFVQGLRVLVEKDEDGNEVDAVGVVSRICTDGERAWVTLDGGKRGEKLWQAGARIRTYPDHCKLAETSLQEQREARRMAGQPVPTLDTFGRDHWGTFLYIETRCVDHGGQPDRRHMRCDNKRHPMHAHLHPDDGGGKEYPTRLKGGVELPDHDDWDCVADLIDAGLLANLGSAIHPMYRLTEEGRRVAALLRVFKEHKGNLVDFSPSWTPPSDAEQLSL